ncbi:hypothetical protein HanRHA438_Chr12g0570061 [Helianthus annuus]|nr:hypothetical protein HanRHA438_Chr12g0570061 [Helianthus annuus]
MLDGICFVNFYSSMATLSCLIQFFFGFTLSILTEESVKKETGLMQMLSYYCRVHHYNIA